MTKIPTKIIGLIVLVFAALGAPTANAQTQVYSQDFETDTTANWLVNVTGQGFSYADFYFDYSTVGIPAAPHQSGSSTRGLKLGANLGVGGAFPAGISVSPLGFGITENFDMRFDFWLNYIKSGQGSTEVAGAGYGTAGTAAQAAGVPAPLLDSIFIGATTDGGSGADYRVYAPDRAISYQDADTVIRTDPTTPLVYAAGSRNNTAAYYVTNFSPGNLVFPPSPVPPAQTNLFPRQTDTVAPAGSAGFRWHEASLRKVGNTITYSIDGLLIATVDARDAATTNVLGGTNILFNFFDINAGGSFDEDATNLLFALFDNVRITNFANVVTADATTPAASEAGPTPGVFTITRTSAGVPLTVNYTMSGTASNGVDYVTLPGSITFGASETSTNITVTPIDDSIPEATETVILTINASPDYIGAGNATIRISDNEPPQLAIRAVNSQMFERTHDYATFQITRLGDTNAAAFAVNVGFSGGATLDTDYTTNGIAMFEPGAASVNFRVLPIEDSLVEGNETIVCTLIATSPYTVGASNSATVTLVDATLAAETVLFSDNFNTDTSASWTRLFGAAPDPADDSFVEFSYNYGNDFIPQAPLSPADTLGLRMTVNKNDPTLSAAAVNYYPNGQSFSGNYALRFNMYLVNGGGASATEYAIFGINHSGTKTNWFRGSAGGIAGGSFDGIFFNIEADGAGVGDYAMYTGPAGVNNPITLASSNASPYAAFFKSPPWTAAGAAANVANSTTPIWADVEVSQLEGVVTLKINNTVILQRTNTTSYTSGNIMLGYTDAFDSIGPIGSTVVYDNVRVVRLTAPVPFRITSVQVVGSNVQIDFTSDLGSASAFKLQGASLVTGPYTDTAAVITAQGETSFRATIQTDGQMQYYKIKF